MCWWPAAQLQQEEAGASQAPVALRVWRVGELASRVRLVQDGTHPASIGSRELYMLAGCHDVEYGLNGMVRCEIVGPSHVPRCYCLLVPGLHPHLPQVL